MTNASTRRWLCTVAMAFLTSVAAAQVSPWQEKNEAGNVAAQAGRYAEAEKLYQSAIKEADAFGKTDTRLATSLANLATVYHLQNKYPEAKDYYQRAIKIWEKSEPPEPLLLASTLDRLATLFRDTSKFDQAEECAKRTVQLRISKLGAQHLDVAEALENLALVYYLQGVLLRPPQSNKSGASPFPEAAGDMSVGSRQTGMTAAQQTGANETYAQMHPMSPEEQRKASMNNLVAGKFQADLFPWNASSPIDKGKLSKAAGNYRQALEIREKLLGPAHPQVAKCLATLADLFMAARDYASAIPYYVRLLGIEDKMFGPADLRRVPALRKYSYALTKMKQNEEAARVDAQLYEILDKNRKP
jgi:tetratricopeptide (TPR) repeat protein